MARWGGRPEMLLAWERMVMVNVAEAGTSGNRLAWL